MADKEYAVVKDGFVTNTVIADNSNAVTILAMLIPDADEFVEITELTGPGAIGGQYIDGQIRPIKRNESWVWDSEKIEWVPPVDRPQDGKNYYWDEVRISWVEAATPENNT